MPGTSDPAELRAAAEAQLERLQGPLWASEGKADDDSPAANRKSTRRTTPPRGATRTARSKATSRPRSKRPPGRPALETPRLPRREVRIPVVVDERMGEVASWGGIEPIEALWLLATLGWEAWRSGREPNTERAPSQVG
jgi:hypothetical protein